MHVHVVSVDGEATFWLEPEIELAKNHRYSRSQLKQIESLVEVRYTQQPPAMADKLKLRTESPETGRIDPLRVPPPGSCRLFLDQSDALGRPRRRISSRAFRVNSSPFKT